MNYIVSSMFFSKLHLHHLWIIFYLLIWDLFFTKDLERKNTNHIQNRKRYSNIGDLVNYIVTAFILFTSSQSRELESMCMIASLSLNILQDITNHKCTCELRLCPKPLQTLCIYTPFKRYNFSQIKIKAKNL